MPRPSIALPPPLRGVEIPSFTNYSIVVRLPDIAKRTLSENNFTPEAAARIEQLIAEIPDGLIRPLSMHGAPDAAQWVIYTQEHVGLNWLEVPWFFAEEYFYQRILEATEYFAPGPGWLKDPYAYQKRRGLETTSGEIRALCERLEGVIRAGKNRAEAREALRQLLMVDLWGNQNDLSLWPAADDALIDHAQPVALREAQEHVLDNHLEDVLDYLSSLDPANTRVDLLLDNAGFELVCDLALADFLLTAWHARQVMLHIKVQPVFVSDAMDKDIRSTLAFLQAHPSAAVRALAERLEAHLNSGRLVMRADPFWTSPLAMWETPEGLLADLRQADLLISKGDANYRRLLGDRHWPIDLPFSNVVDYLPVAVLGLRTLKSEIAVGVLPKHVPAGDPDWMINGHWGLVQFAPGSQRD